MRKIIEDALARRGIGAGVADKTVDIFTKNLSCWNLEPEIYVDTAIWLYEKENSKSGLATDFTLFKPDYILSPLVIANYGNYMIDCCISEHPTEAVRHIQISTQKTWNFMADNKFDSFRKYLEFGIELYPPFIEHIKNGRLNLFLLAFVDRNDIIFNKIARDVQEMLRDYEHYRERLRIRILRSGEIENALNESVKILNMEVIC